MQYGFIGCGNMGGAIVRAMSKTTHNISLSSKNGKRSRILADELGLRAANSNEDIARSCDCIFLGVKPQNMAETIKPIASILAKQKPMLVTMAAGLTTKSIRKMVDAEIGVVRIMPNTPVAVGAGLILYCANEYVNDKDLAQVIQDMKPCGTLDSIDENLIDAGCAVSGCGPAFVYMFIDALAKGGKSCGLNAEKARMYAEITCAGAAKLSQNQATNKTCEQLKNDVCSPGGSTVEGVRALEEENFAKSCENAVKAAYKRTKELGE